MKAGNFFEQATTVVVFPPPETMFSRWFTFTAVQHRVEMIKISCVSDEHAPSFRLPAFQMNIQPPSNSRRFR
jgi:hypothetical protein